MHGSPKKDRHEPKMNSTSEWKLPHVGRVWCDQQHDPSHWKKLRTGRPGWWALTGAYCGGTYFVLPTWVGGRPGGPARFALMLPVCTPGGRGGYAPNGGGGGTTPAGSGWTAGFIGACPGATGTPAGTGGTTGSGCIRGAPGTSGPGGHFRRCPSPGPRPRPATAEVK